MEQDHSELYRVINAVRVMYHIGICLFISHSLMLFFSLYIALYTRLREQIQLRIKKRISKRTQGGLNIFGAATRLF